MHSDTRAISGALKLRLRNLSTGLATGDVIDPGSGSTLQGRRRGSGAAKAGGNVEFKPVKGFVRGGEGGMVLTDQEKVVKGGCMYVVPQRRLGTSPFFQMGGSSLVVRGLGLLGPRVSLDSKRVGRTGWAERKKTRYIVCTRYRGNASDFVTKPATPRVKIEEPPPKCCRSESSTFPAHQPTHLAFFAPCTSAGSSGPKVSVG